MREDVVRDHEAARLDLLARKAEELFVVVFLGVEEDQVEHVVDQRQLLERVALAQLGPLPDARLLDVALPGLDPHRVVLEREDAPAEVPDARPEPDRGVAARAAELEHLAVGLRRDERKEEPAGRRLDLARALLGREPALTLRRVLTLEALEYSEYAVVEHGPETIVGPVRA